jgi:hypothetical protein
MFYDLVLTSEKVAIIQRRIASLSRPSGNRHGCNWVGCKMKSVYGTKSVSVGGRAYQLRIHRLQYYISKGLQPLPVSKQVSHLCHNQSKDATINSQRCSCVSERHCLGHGEYQPRQQPSVGLKWQMRGTRGSGSHQWPTNTRLPITGASL